MYKKRDFVAKRLRAKLKLIFSFLQKHIRPFITFRDVFNRLRTLNSFYPVNTNSYIERTVSFTVLYCFNICIIRIQ